jgi:hypothetical protein
MAVPLMPDTWQVTHFGSLFHGTREPLATVEATFARLPWQAVQFPSAAVCLVLLLHWVTAPGWQS